MCHALPDNAWPCLSPFSYPCLDAQIQFLFWDAADEDSVWIASQRRPSTSSLHLCELNEQEHPGAESDVAICCALCKQVIWPVQKWEPSIVLFSRTLQHSSECKPKAGPTARRANGSAQGMICNRCQRHERTHSPEQNLGKQLSVNKVGASAMLICSVLNGSGKGG